MLLKNYNNDNLDVYAELKSPTLAGQSIKDRCFEFWFQQTKTQILNVYKFYPSQIKKILAWTLTAQNSTQENKWIRATIPFTAESPFNFILEGENLILITLFLIKTEYFFLI